jgi:hypothetical protein
MSNTTVISALHDGKTEWNGGTAPLILNFGTTYSLGALPTSKVPPVMTGQEGLGERGHNPSERFYEEKDWPLPSIEL